MGCLQRRLYIQTQKNYDHCALWFMLVSSDTIFIKIVPTGSNNIFDFTITCSSLSRRENYTAPPFRRYIFCSPEAYHRIQIALYYLAAFPLQFVTSSLFSICFWLIGINTRAVTCHELRYLNRWVASRSRGYPLPPATQAKRFATPGICLSSITSRCSGKEPAFLPLGEGRRPETRERRKSSVFTVLNSHKRSFFLCDLF